MFPISKMAMPFEGLSLYLHSVYTAYCAASACLNSSPFLAGIDQGAMPHRLAPMPHRRAYVRYAHDRGNTPCGGTSRWHSKDERAVTAHSAMRVAASGPQREPERQNPVMPAQRVASACNTSTASASAYGGSTTGHSHIRPPRCPCRKGRGREGSVDLPDHRTRRVPRTR